MAKKRGPTPPRQWQPMQPATAIPPSAEDRAAFIAYAVEHEGETTEAATAKVDRMIAERSEMWRNDRYVASVDRDDDGNVACLSIRRDDRRAVHDWRDLQRIKNDIAGPEIEAIELYPAESRLMDTANQYWLWCALPGARIEVGFEGRSVNTAVDRIGRSRQRVES